MSKVTPINVHHPHQLIAQCHQGFLKINNEHHQIQVQSQHQHSGNSLPSNITKEFQQCQETAFLITPDLINQTHLQQCRKQLSSHQI